MDNTYTLGKLQTYEECPQKYKLCYIDKVHIVESINSRDSEETGTKLHNLINYYLKGKDVTPLTKTLTFPEKEMWKNFLNIGIEKYQYLQSEYSFNIRFSNAWLTGRIDALFKNNDQFIIADWKTGESFLPSTVKFQTTFYLLSIYEILRMKNYIKYPEDLSLIYYNINSNNKIQIDFNYDLYIQYKSQISNLIEKIQSDDKYCCYKTDKCKICKYLRACPYF